MNQGQTVFSQLMSFLPNREFRRCVARYGGDASGKKNSALLAVAHTILQLVYEVLRTGQPYRDRQAPALSGQQKDRLIRHHVRRLGKLGVRVYSLSAGAGSQKALSAN